MKKTILILFFASLILMTGCNTTKPNVTPFQPAVKEVWFGDKQEIKTFLDSPAATSDRWFIQSIL
jgi:hypothetical protein